MRLNRKTEPVVYRRTPIRTSLLEDEARRSQAQMDIVIGIYAMAFIVFLFVVLG